MEHGTKEPPHYLIQRVREALAHDPRVGELELRVKMVGAKVFVTGSVQTDERREAVSTIVREVLPEAEVHNEITITTLADADQEELT
jgi:osmotically-inducible protein OsmY